MLPSLVGYPVQYSPLPGLLFLKPSLIGEPVHLVARTFGGHVKCVCNFRGDHCRICGGQKLLKNLVLLNLWVWSTWHT